MGANAQTSVPLFVANSVLTAAQQNISAATGVPVFATTVTRDAAFGGSNKVLAEGQLCYLESTNVTQYYDGAAWATVGPTVSKILQVVSGSTSTQASSSVATFADTGLTATITPTLATSKVLVVVSQNGCVKTSGNLNNAMNLKLLRGATDIQTFGSDVGYTNSATSLYIGCVSTQFLDSPATTSATTYKTQFANDVAAAAVRVQDGSLTESTIILYEVSA